MARELGLEAPPIAWHTRRAGFAEIGTWLAMLLGTLAKFAFDVAHLASTEVGEVAEPHLPGRGGSSAMPHKRNPISATVILSAHLAAKGQVTMLLDAMAAAHERPAGAWHAEWHALPQLFGLASGSLREARGLAEGLVVDADRMRRNIEATRGLLFADAVAARLAPSLGRDRAHPLIERAADRVRTSEASLADVLRTDPEFSRDVPTEVVTAAFNLAPSVDAAAGWVDRALTEVGRIRERLRSSSPAAA
jgi:3-carboxy-cis,cis-muconate cycloisomerase